MSGPAGEGRESGRAGWSILFLSLLFFFMVGFVFPGSDMMLILPRLAADVPTTWSLDPYFSRPADSYLFNDLLFRLGGRILPLVVLLPALSLFSTVLLAAAVLDLARQEAGDRFAPLSIGLAVLATGVATLGNMLLGDASILNSRPSALPRSPRPRAAGRDGSRPPRSSSPQGSFIP